MPIKKKKPAKKQLKLPIWDQRMLFLMQHCISNRLCTSIEFCESIDFPVAALSQVRNRKQSFRLDNIQRAGLKYNVNINWIMGFDQEMKRKPGKSALQVLKDAIAGIEADM